MGEWRFTTYDLRTGNKGADLDVLSWTSTDVLRDAGPFSASIVLDGAASTATTSRRATVAGATLKGRTEIIAERDGVPAFSGIIWGRRYQGGAQILEVAGRSMLSYFDHHAQTWAANYVDVDQLAILRDLVARVQALGGADIGIDMPVVSSGVLRKRPYLPFSGATVGELMRQLSRVSNGFDFDVRSEYDAGAVVRRLRTWYPRRGRSVEATGLTFRSPGNVLSYDMEDDGSEMATTVSALGAGDGPDMLVTTASDTSQVGAGWPAFSTTRAHKDVRRTTTLQSHAAADVARLSGVDDERFSVVVDPDDRMQPWGSWDLGDDCTLVVDDDAMYPAKDDGTPGLVVVRRVVGHTWDITPDREQLTVILDRKVIP